MLIRWLVLVVLRETQQSLVAALRLLLLVKVKEEFVGSDQIDCVSYLLLQRLADLVDLVNVEVLLSVFILAGLLVTNEHDDSLTITSEAGDVAVIYDQLQGLNAKLNAVHSA